MTELHIVPEQHFDAMDYAESELLIFKYDPKGKRLLLCFDDLSEKIPEWVSGKKKVSYFFRYKIIYFHRIFDFKRSEVDLEECLELNNDFYMAPEAPVILIDDINVKRQPAGYKVYLSFERGFGIAEFDCKEMKMYEFPFYFKKRHAGKNYYYIDPVTKKTFDEEAFLGDLYEGKHLTE